MLVIWSGDRIVQAGARTDSYLWWARLLYHRVRPRSVLGFYGRFARISAFSQQVFKRFLSGRKISSKR